MSATEEEQPSLARYASGSYWQERSDLIYYRYLDYIMRVVGAQAGSLVDIGTGNCPYLEWFPWIERRVSVDLKHPYRSDTVEGIAANILDHRFSEQFDICLCLQVLEHVPEAERFARRLLEIGKTVVVSVPFNWPEGETRGHVQDPVDLRKLTSWFERDPNYYTVITEPFRYKKHQRLLAVYDVANPRRKFGRPEIDARRLPQSVA